MKHEACKCLTHKALSMSPRLAVAAFALALSLLLYESGCTSPRAQVAAAADVYAAVIETAADLRDAGALTPEQVRRIDVLQRVAGESLNAWAASVRAGRPDGVCRGATLAALEALQQLLIEASDGLSEGSPVVAGGAAAD